MDQLKYSTWLAAVSILVAVCALLFTVFSFWWINARRGRIKSFEPHTFAFGSTSAVVRLRLPLVLYNNGAAPIIIQNLRLDFSRRLRIGGFSLMSRSAQLLSWVASRSQLKPEQDDGHAFPAVFSVAGRTAQQVFVEFGEASLGFTLESRPYSVRVEVKLGHKCKWRKFLDFTLQAGQITEPGQFITYENTPPTQERRQEAEKALKNHAPNRGASSGP